ncbi:MAG: ORF6N domain-containing protein [Candidatus Paceibacterota bacterium]
MNIKQIVPVEVISQKIFIIRGRKVMLGQHLAELYETPVKILIQAVKRNIERFPEDFMFQLTQEEFVNLKSQFVTSSWGGIRRALPYAFTEHGVTMLSSVLRSPQAIQMNIFIVRAFVRIRELLASNKELGYKIEEIEREQKTQNRHINAIYRILDKLVAEPIKPKESMGFRKD